MKQAAVRIGTWNAEWAVPGKVRGERFREHLAEPGCNVLCVTEGCAGLLPDGGHMVESDPDYGYPIKEGRRKVIIWSERPWANADSLGSADLPRGRFAAGTTETPVGPLTVVGVCIPWGHAHVKGGHQNRKPWD